jgi:hypothetical protein
VSTAPVDSTETAGIEAADAISAGLPARTINAETAVNTAELADVLLNVSILA